MGTFSRRFKQQVLESVRIDDSDTIEGSSSTPTNAKMNLDTKEEDATEERSGDHDDEYNDVEFDDEY